MIQTNNKKCRSTELRKYCHLSDKDDSMEVTEWVNGEGWDVVIQAKDSGEQRFSLTYGQMTALMVLVHYQE